MMKKDEKLREVILNYRPTGNNEYTNFDKLKYFINEIDASKDPQKFYKKDNCEAGIRLRKAMQIIKQIAQNVRVEINERKQLQNDYKPNK